MLTTLSATFQSSTHLQYLLRMRNNRCDNFVEEGEDEVQWELQFVCTLNPESAAVRGIELFHELPERCSAYVL